MGWKKSKIPFSYFVDTDKLILTDMAGLFKYADGKKTGEVIGVKADVVEPKNLDKISVKVLNLNPKITKEMLEASMERVYVRLINAYATPYVYNGHIEYSVSAEDIVPVKNMGAMGVKRPENNQ